MGSVNTARSTESRPAHPVHKLQGIRCRGRDYRIPAFYLITMATLDREPLFATCEDARSTLTRELCLAMNRWCAEIAAEPVTPGTHPCDGQP